MREKDSTYPFQKCGPAYTLILAQKDLLVSYIQKIDIINLNHCEMLNCVIATLGYSLPSPFSCEGEIWRFFLKSLFNMLVERTS